jgi:hypothetical protein
MVTLENDDILPTSSLRFRLDNFLTVVFLRYRILAHRALHLI